MKNLNMRKKCTVSLGVVIICFLIALIFTMSGMSNIAGKYTTFYTLRHEATMRARNMRVQLQSAVKNVTLATVEPDMNASNTLLNEAQSNLDTLNSEMSWFQSNFDGDISLLNTFKSKLEEAGAYRQTPRRRSCWLTNTILLRLRPAISCCSSLTSRTRLRTTIIMPP